MSRLAPSALCGLLLLAAAAPAAAELEELLANHYEALGGLEALAALDSIRMSGTMLMAGMEAPFQVVVKRPDKVRVEFTLQGMTGIQAFDGETGWSVMPFLGKSAPEAMPAEETELLREQADFEGPLVGYEAKGNRVELLGREDLEGTPVYRLKVTLSGGQVQEIFLDAEHHLVLKQTGTRTMQGQQFSYETVIGDYKPVEGVLMPHSIETTMVGMDMTQSMVLERIEVGIELDEDHFSMPAAQE